MSPKPLTSLAVVDHTGESCEIPAAPANLIEGELATASNGRYYHAIMYGKNVMGAYKDKMSYEERWQVIHYIRSLQAKKLKLVYTAEANTLNDSFGTPMAMIKQVAELPEQDILQNVTEEAHDGEDHGGDHASDDHGDGHH